MVQEQLRDVEQVCANAYAFAAVRRDGTVVTWGQALRGGDSSYVQHQLINVEFIYATAAAFAAARTDGTVVTWGDASRGGDGCPVQLRAGPSSQI